MDIATRTREQRTDQGARLALIGFIVVGAFIGYEWFMSGLTKIVRGGFPSGLADELREKSEGTVGWYRSFLDGTVIPNGNAFGILIELSELAIGVALIGAAILMLWRWQRLSYRQELAVLAAVAIASVAGILMNVNFHLANGSPHPWLIPADGFDEGVDMDSLLPLIQLTFAVVSARLFLTLRRQHRAAQPADAQPPQTPAPSRPASLAG
jgi:hypothetical protein